MLGFFALPGASHLPRYLLVITLRAEAVRRQGPLSPGVRSGLTAEMVLGTTAVVTITSAHHSRWLIHIPSRLALTLSAELLRQGPVLGYVKQAIIVRLGCGTSAEETSITAQA